MTASTTDRIRRHLVGLKMPRALEALQTTLELRLNIAADQLRGITANGWLCGAPVAVVCTHLAASVRPALAP